MINFTQGNAVDWARTYTGPLFHALLCDPPYHLQSIVKRFGKTDSAPAQYGKDGAFARASRGFMGKTWDGGDVAFDPETWAAFGSVMYPGAFGMAFASSRGWHRLAVAIEDGGFVIHPSIFGWAYGSGFPKATRVNHGATQFDGHRYGLQALKPALEPIIVFQKPYNGRPIDNITATGAGTLNIDAARIGTEEIPSNQWVDNAHPFGGGAGNEYETVTNRGRWPSNLVLLDNGAAQALDRQSGHLVSGQPSGMKNADNNIYGQYGKVPITGFGDEGGASRFFFKVQEQIDCNDPVYYVAKASNDERNAGLENMPMVELGHGGKDVCGNCGGYILQTANRPSACSCENPDRQNKKARNPHPTVKPIELARYLATLLLPPTEYAPRRLFVPFAGVASECIGAMQAGWDEITGVELTAEYIPIAQARIDYWRQRGWQTTLFDLDQTP